MQTEEYLYTGVQREANRRKVNHFDFSYVSKCFTLLYYVRDVKV